MEAKPESGALSLLAKWLEKEEAYRKAADSSDSVIRCGTPASPDIRDVRTPEKQGPKNYMLQQYVATPTSSQRRITRRRLNFRDPAFIYELEDISDEEPLTEHSTSEWDEVDELVFNLIHEFPANGERCVGEQAKFEPSMDGEEACMEFPHH